MNRIDQGQELLRRHQKRTLTRFVLIVLLCSAACHPAAEAERSDGDGSDRVVAEDTAFSNVEPCEPTAEVGSVIGGQEDPQDFRYRILPDRRNSLEEPTRRAEPVEPIVGELTEASIRNKVDGVVILEVGVRSDGTVAGARVLKGLPCGLDARAIEAVEGAEFKPATLDGRPIDTITNVMVRFEHPLRQEKEQ